MLPDHYKRKLSKEEINALPIVRYEGKIELVTTAEELDKALKVLHKEHLLGFDTETKPSFRKGKLNNPALVQLAAENVVYLIQLVHVPFAAELAGLLSNERIIKVGVSIFEDMRELQRIYNFEAAGIMDLGNIARANNLETQGLRNLAANFFDYRISKGSQCSNWSASTLSEKQIIYAATDAWIGRKVFVRMQELGMLEKL